LVKEKMLKYLPIFEQKSKVFQELISVQGQELDRKALMIKDLEKQLAIDTATWALELYEKELGILTDLNRPYEERRSTIKSKWRGAGKVDSNLIKLVADAYTNGDVKVSFDGKIHIEFESVYGIPPNIEDLKQALEDIKPAHLAIAYMFKYLIWNQFDDYNKTWDEWDQLNLSWDEFEIYKGV
jgi:hypothetical protein